MRSFITLIGKTYRMAHPRERTIVMHNVAALSVLQFVTYLLPIIIIPYLFRVLGPEKFGLIAFAQAFVQYFIILTDYGFNISATKQISLCRKRHAHVCEAFSSVMIVKAALALVSLLVFCSIVFSVPRFKSDWMVYVFSFGAVIGSALFPTWFFQGIEKMRYITVLNIAGGIFFAVAVFFFVRGPQDYLIVPVINSCVFLIPGLLGQYVVFRKFRVPLAFPGYTSLQQQLKAGWDIFISIAAINAYTTTRVFIIGLLTNNNITGFYSMAEKIANACQTFPLDAFSRALFPRLSAMFHKNKTKALTLMRQIQQITVVVSLVFLPVVFTLAGGIVKAVCGGDYPQTTVSLRLLLIAVFFVAANAFRVQFLLVCGRTRLYSRIHVIAATIALPALFLSIYLFSYVGAAGVTVAVEAGIFAVTYRVLRKLKFS